MADPKAERRGARGVVSAGLAVREKIEISRIVNRLNKNALGELVSKDGEVYYMNDSEMKSSQMLLDRVLPKLTSQTVKVDGNMSVTTVTRKIVDGTDD